MWNSYPQSWMALQILFLAVLPDHAAKVVHTSNTTFLFFFAGVSATCLHRRVERSDSLSKKLLAASTAAYLMLFSNGVTAIMLPISFNAFAFNIVAPLRVVGAAAVKVMTSPCGLTFDSKINNRSKVFFLSSQCFSSLSTRDRRQ